MFKAATGKRYFSESFIPYFLVQRLGCFKDTWRRAVPQLDGKSRLLTGNYQRRKYAIRKCALAAARRGYKVFGVQHGGWCASGPRAQKTYAKYGRSNRCRNGKGGPWANDVYVVSGKLLRYSKQYQKLPLLRILNCEHALANRRIISLMGIFEAGCLLEAGGGGGHCFKPERKSLVIGEATFVNSPNVMKKLVNI